MKKVQETQEKKEKKSRRQKRIKSEVRYITKRASDNIFLDLIQPTPLQIPPRRKTKKPISGTPKTIK